MPEDEENEKGRISVEFLRLISFLVEYLDRSTIVSAFIFLGLSIVFLSVILYIANLITILVLMVVLFYGGFFLFYAALYYQKKMRKRFRKYLDAASSSTLIKSSEYEELLERFQDRFAHEYEMAIDDASNQIGLMNEEMLALQKKRNQLLREIEELQKKRKEEVG